MKYRLNTLALVIDPALVGWSVACGGLGGEGRADSASDASTPAAEATPAKPPARIMVKLWGVVSGTCSSARRWAAWTLYALAAEQWLGRLFLAGNRSGVVLAMMFAAYGMYRSRFEHRHARDHADAGRPLALSESAMPMVIIGMSLLYSCVMSFVRISQGSAGLIVPVHLSTWLLLAALVVLGRFAAAGQHHPNDGAQVGADIKLGDQ